MVALVSFLQTLYRLGLARDGDVPNEIVVPIWLYKEMAKELYPTIMTDEKHFRPGFGVFGFSSVYFGQLTFKPEMPT